MKKYLAVALAGLMAISVAACGSSSPAKKAPVKEASSAPVPTTTTAAKPVAKTDLALCSQGRTDLAAFVATTQGLANKSDSEVESLAGTSMLPALEKVQQDITQMRAEATSTSDLSRLDSASSGLGQIHGGLAALSTGDPSGMSQVTAGVGSISQAEGLQSIALCGSTPN